MNSLLFFEKYKNDFIDLSNFGERYRRFYRFVEDF